MKFRPVTDEGDYQIKLRNMREFLLEGDKIKVNIRFRGREMSHQELGREMAEPDRGRPGRGHRDRVAPAPGRPADGDDDRAEEEDLTASRADALSHGVPVERRRRKAPLRLGLADRNPTAESFQAGSAQSP